MIFCDVLEIPALSNGSFEKKEPSNTSYKQFVKYVQKIEKSWKKMIVGQIPRKKMFLLLSKKEIIKK
jgi:hypothetical protein